MSFFQFANLARLQAPRTFTNLARSQASRTLSQTTRTTARPNMSNFFQHSHRPGLVASRLTNRPFLRRTYYSGWPGPGNSQTQANMKILYGIIGANCGVFAYYCYLDQQAKQGVVKPLIDFVRNFTLNLNTFKDEGRYWTPLTSCFTHFGGMHLLGNMMSFFFMGQLLTQAPVFTPFRFLTLILGAGLTGSAGYLYSRMEETKNSYGRDQRRALGFSGAVMGVGSVAACMFPRVTFHIYGIIPMPLWALMGGYFLYDSFYLGSQRTGVAHAGHLGGAVFGLGYYFLHLRGIRL